MTRKCKFCMEEFEPRAAGRKQIFCSSKCRKIFEKQLRQWALVQVARGKVDLETLVLNKRGKMMDDTLDVEGIRKRNTSV